jgi:hypothetical protein
LSLPFRRYIKAHHVSRAALITAGIAAAFVFFLLGAALRLLVGPVSLGPFGGTLSNALADALPGITVKYDQAAVEWSRDQGRINLVILGARVFDPEGRIIAQAPKADIDLAARPLLEGKVVVQRITLVGVQLTLMRTKEGGLRLGVEKDKNQHDILSRITDAITASNSKASSLQTFAVRDARLAFFDEPSGLFIVAPRADFRVATSGANLEASIDADVEISGRAAHVKGDFIFPPKKGPVRGAVSVLGLDISALGSNAKAFESVKGVGLTVDMSASFAVQGVHLLGADFGIGAKGTLDIPGLAKGPMRVRVLQVVGRYDGATGRVLIDDGTFDAGGTRAHLAGSGDLSYDGAGALARIGIDLTMDKMTAAMPGVLAEPISLQTAAFHGAYLPATKDILIDRFNMAGGPFSLQATGKVTLVDGQSPAIEIKGQLGALNLHDFLRFWPLGVGAGARDWVAGNMFAGTVGPLTFETHMPAGALDQPVLADGALLLLLPLNGAEVNYVRGLTHLTQVMGTAKLTGDNFSADINSARIGPLVVTKGHATIAELHASGVGEFTVHVQGGMPDVLTLIDLQPLNYPTRFGISTHDTKGIAGLDLAFQVPLRKNLNVDDVGISIKAAISEFAISLNDHTRLTDGVVDLAIDNDKLHASGTASLADSKLNFDWTEDFKAAGPVTTRIALKGLLADGAREMLNFHSADVLKGPIGVSGTLTGHRGGLLQADMTMDLAPATIALDLIGVSKPSGFPATAHVSATFGPASTIKTETMKLTGPSISAQVNATFDKTGRLATLTAPAVRIGASDDFSLNVTRGPNGIDILMRGHSLDGSRIASRGSGSSGGGDEASFAEPFHVNAKMDRLLMRDGLSISPFALDVTGIADRPATMALSGTLAKTATITGGIVATSEGRHVTFATSDVGLLFKGLFGFNSLKGGKLEVTAVLPGRASDPTPKDGTAPDYQGKFSLTDFKIVDQPFLARIFAAGSLGGLINLLQNQGIVVDKLDVPFSARNDVISVHDARATGPAIGMTADGYVDRPKNSIALKGSLVPLFGLNNILGNLPLLGDVLISKQGEGVFGMTYSVKGDADQPDVSVNPLAVLTPGIFRRIFEGKMPTAAQAPSNALPVIPPPKPDASTPKTEVTPPVPSNGTPPKQQ